MLVATSPTFSVPRNNPLYPVYQRHPPPQLPPRHSLYPLYPLYPQHSPPSTCPPAPVGAKPQLITCHLIVGTWERVLYMVRQQAQHVGLSISQSTRCRASCGSDAKILMSTRYMNDRGLCRYCIRHEYTDMPRITGLVTVILCKERSCVSAVMWSDHTLPPMSGTIINAYVTCTR